MIIYTKCECISPLSQGGMTLLWQTQKFIKESWYHLKFKHWLYIIKLSTSSDQGITVKLLTESAPSPSLLIDVKDVRLAVLDEMETEKNNWKLRFQHIMLHQVANTNLIFFAKQNINLRAKHGEDAAGGN